MKFFTVLSVAITALALGSCQDNVEITNTIFTEEEMKVIVEEFNEDFLEAPDYSDPSTLPEHFRRFGFGQLSKLEKWQVHLGRALFYDVRLSEDMTISCGSCHKQELGFADNVAFSEGIKGRSTARNSQSINNIRAYYGDSGQGFFWDSRANSLQEQATETMANPDEMGMTLQAVRERLQQIPAYEILFDKVYRDASIKEKDITDALAAFTRSISSTGSHFDQALDKEMRSSSSGSFSFGRELVMPAFEDFTDQENRGKTLYLNNCASCHSTQLPTRLDNKANGLYALGAYQDKGKGGLPGYNTVEWEGYFKTPQLRNVALTAPYMHDGSITTLREVIDHYSSGIEDNPNLSQELKNLQLNANGKRGFGFSESEKEDLEAFLITLTDTRLAGNPDLSDPFTK